MDSMREEERRSSVGGGEWWRQRRRHRVVAIGTLEERDSGGGTGEWRQGLERFCLSGTSGFGPWTRTIMSRCDLKSGRTACTAPDR